jgi:hypothetical protein
VLKCRFPWQEMDRVFWNSFAVTHTEARECQSQEYKC